MKRPFYQLNQSKDVIRHFTPNWFTATMGTGVVSMILIQLPFAKSFYLCWLRCYGNLILFYLVFFSSLFIAVVSFPS